MRKKILAAIILAWACTAFAADYTINAFNSGVRSTPPASNEIIESFGGKVLVKASPDERLKPGEIILRRRFDASDYWLYKGRMTQSALSGEADLTSFPFPDGMQRSDALQQKYYTEKAINPDQDISSVYCDDANLYVKQARTIYWNKNGQWYALKASDLKVDKTKNTGPISVCSTPQGAQVFIDEENKGRTNGYIDGIFPGEHLIRVELEGYRKAEKTIVFKLNDDVPQYSFNLISAYGTLSLHSNPEGAAVIIRGEKKSSVTPLQLFNLLPGRYPIRFEKEWYLPAVDTLMVNMNETTSVMQKLRPDFGSVEVSSSPENARIIIDGVDHGAAPVNIERQPPGKFNVVVQADMYKRTDTVLTVKRGESIKLNVILKPDFGTLILNKGVGGSLYKVDGNDLPDAAIRLRPGKHHITMDGRGKYSNIDTILDIRDGGTISFGGISQRLTGSIQVRPIPFDAEIFLDGESKGTGGKTLRDVPTGLHSVSAQKQGYHLSKQNVEIKTGDVCVINVSLTQNSEQDADSINKCPNDSLITKYSAYKALKNDHAETVVLVGEQILKNKKTASTIKDIDGNVYHTITIGTQTWTVENLKTTHYNDGTAIPLITFGGVWNNLKTPGYCWYDNDSTTNKKVYGALYNWYAVRTGKLAPKGWHVPTDAEWDTLQNYLIAHGYNYDGTRDSNRIAKSMAAQMNWSTSTSAGTIGNDLSTNNRSGFSALPGGYRNLNGSFGYIGNNGYWWSATEGNASIAYYRCLYYNSSYLGRYYYYKSCGFSVRLVRDSN